MYCAHSDGSKCNINVFKFFIRCVQYSGNLTGCQSVRFEAVRLGLPRVSQYRRYNFSVSVKDNRMTPYTILIEHSNCTFFDKLVFL